MERAKGSPDCVKCSYYNSCDDPQKETGYWCICYELDINKSEMAWCSTCKKYLPKHEFRKNSLRKSVVGSSCRSCERIRENSAGGRYKSYKRNAKQRNIDFNISKEEFMRLIIDKCRYCGEYGNPYNGVDRVDNRKGYTVSNCVSCCEWCNKIKMSHTIEEMMDHIKKIYECMIG